MKKIRFGIVGTGNIAHRFADAICNVEGAQLSSAIMLKKPNEGYLYGTKGYVRLERFYAPQKLELYLNDGTSQTVEAPYEGNGFEEQIRHFCDCVNKGLTESPVVTWADTLFVMRQMDEIRRQTGVFYPQDEK